MTAYSAPRHDVRPAAEFFLMMHECQPFCHHPLLGIGQDLSLPDQTAGRFMRNIECQFMLAVDIEIRCFLVRRDRLHMMKTEPADRFFARSAKRCKAECATDEGTLTEDT